LDLVGRRVVREVIAARTAYEIGRAELRYLTGEALPEAQRALDLVATGWRSGRFDIFRVTTAARDFARLLGLRLDALEAVWLERVALDYAVGGFET
jgi:outer membrane protein TolC